MGKCRPLNNDEVDALIHASHDVRNTALLVGIKTTGYRSSEMHHMTVDDVYDFTKGTIKPRIQVRVKFMKKQQGRMALPIVPEWRQALVLWLAKLKEQGFLRPGVPLWLSRKRHATNQPDVHKLFGLARETIWRIVRGYAIKAGVNPDRVGVHSVRKNFCVKMYLGVWEQPNTKPG